MSTSISEHTLALRYVCWCNKLQGWACCAYGLPGFCALTRGGTYGFYSEHMHTAHDPDGHECLPEFSTEICELVDPYLDYVFPNTIYSMHRASYPHMWAPRKYESGRMEISLGSMSVFTDYRQYHSHSSARAAHNDDRKQQNVSSSKAVYNDGRHQQTRCSDKAVYSDDRQFNQYSVEMFVVNDSYRSNHSGSGGPVYANEHNLKHQSSDRAIYASERMRENQSSAPGAKLVADNIH
jgi:hypothetical protein